MRAQRLLILFFSIAPTFSCTKEGADVILVEGTVRDEASKQPLPGLLITIDAIKPPSGMGIITDGKRETVGRTTTDANGYYKVRLPVFNEAESLAFYLNPGQLKDGYAESQQELYVANVKGRADKIDFTLSPTALLTIKFKNANPVSDSDFFYFSWTSKGSGWTKGMIQQEQCGTVTPSAALTWTGKDVCGRFTIETIAEKYTTVFWMVKKKGITKQYADSVFVKRGMINEFSLNY